MGEDVSEHGKHCFLKLDPILKDVSNHETQTYVDGVSEDESHKSFVW